jgi:DNA-binding CsgD family transcriptional regulator
MARIHSQRCITAYAWRDLRSALTYPQVARGGYNWCDPSMSRAPQQPKEVDRFEAVLREGHKLARQFDVCLKDITDYFGENLADATRQLLVAVPQQMDAWRQEAVEKYGYDPGRREWPPNCEESVKSAEDAQNLVTLLNHYYTYRLVVKQWESFVRSGLSGERLHSAVCQSIIEAYRQRPGLAAKGIEALEAGMPGFPQGLALSVYLTAHVATHTSLKYQRLRAGIDELRTDGESRFSRLLKELPAEVLAAYRGREAGWGDLMDVRTEAVRRLEKTKPTSEAHELVAFADREVKLRLLKHGREVGLPPREYELLKLLVEKPNILSGDAGKALGITPGAIRALKSRIYKTLKVA